MKRLPEPVSDWPWQLIAGVFLFLVAYRGLARSKSVPEGLRLPPGPPRRSIMRNISDLPTHQEWEIVAQWGRKYGDLVHLKVLNSHLIYVNSAKIAHELFEKRSAIYSDRFEFPMMSGLMGAGWVIIHALRRKMAAVPQNSHSRLSSDRLRGVPGRSSQSDAGSSLKSNLTEQLQKPFVELAFLRKLRQTPKDFAKHLRHLSGAIITEITYGIEVLPEGDPYIKTAEAAMRAIGEAGNAGAFLVDTFPVCTHSAVAMMCLFALFDALQVKYIPAWVPGAGFRRKAQAWRETIARLAEAPFEAVKRQMDAGTIKTSFLSNALEAVASPEEEDMTRNAAGVADLAGADTVLKFLLHYVFSDQYVSDTGATLAFLLAMVLYPEVQRKAQRELDKVIGTNRQPGFEDRDHLPYINALCKEVLRWRPVSPLVLAHKVSQDDVYGDFFIPGGSIIIGNSWAMLREEKLFGPGPEKFIPERFLDSQIMEPIFSWGWKTVTPVIFLYSRLFHNAWPWDQPLANAIRNLCFITE